MLNIKKLFHKKSTKKDSSEEQSADQTKNINIDQDKEQTKHEKTTQSKSPNKKQSNHNRPKKSQSNNNSHNRRHSKKLTKSRSLENRLLVKSSIDNLNKSAFDELSRLFYRELFHLDINLKSIFPGNTTILNRKFSSTLGTFKDVKHLEKMTLSIEKLGERHILIHGAQIEHFDTAKQALLYAFSEHLKEQFTPELKEAWSNVFDDVVFIMKHAMSKMDRRKTTRKLNTDKNNDLNLLNDIGGEKVIMRVHTRFYDELFDHPWLGKFFFGKSKETLIKKQTQFMVAAFNGPNNYRGDTPAFVHMHMFITNEMSNVRSKLLYSGVVVEGVSEAIADRWLKVDNVFRPGIVKKSVDECVMKCKGQLPVTAEKP